MVKSMTGFGRAVVTLPNKKATIEVKSLNSKQVDLNVKIPSFYREKELKLRDLAAKALLRGKIDLSIYVETTGESKMHRLNIPAVEAYMQDLSSMAVADVTQAQILAMAVKMPETVKTEREELDEAEWVAIENGVKEAIALCNKYREDEGVSLRNDLKGNIQNIKDAMLAVKPFEDERKVNTRERLMAAIEQAGQTQNLDQNRFEQELIYYLEKYDINEETVRLDNHLSYFLETLELDGAGKKLGFIAQEIGREVNTMGSKANHAEIQQIVVGMKDSLEKIKEQILNVL